MKPSYFFLGHRLLSTQPTLGDIVIRSRPAQQGVYALMGDYLPSELKLIEETSVPEKVIVP
jgi:hypothetical protein